MKKLMITTAIVALSTIANAADLPNRKAAPAIVPIVEERLPFFVGGRGGWASNNGWNAGANIGWEFNRYARVELDYDHIQANGIRSDIISGNGILQYPLDQWKVTPYVIGGIGYRWGNTYDYAWKVGNVGWGINNSFNEAIWNVGAGARYELTRNVELDLRYRYMQGFSTGYNNHVVSLGANYRF